jgi:DNA recombination protein RmuC
MTFIYIIIIGLLIISLITLFFILKMSSIKQTDEILEIKFKLNALPEEIGRLDSSVKSEFATNRKETNDISKTGRQELFSSLKSFEEKLNTLTSTIESKLNVFNESNTKNSKENRQELKDALESFKIDFSKSINNFNTIQKDNFFALLNKQDDQNKSTSLKLDQMRETLEKKISDMQSGNEKKLEEMRVTVDEKLQKTLETRLGESFKQVSERLEAVHKGLGDMQQLATGVGDLKRVLTNVKTRGVLGEYQLENILDQILTLDQYAKNVKTKEGSNAVVEFAIKLPGRGEDVDKILWLPIDSKFPKEDFELLNNAYDQADPELIEELRKNFVRGIKKCAFEISTKYIDPPNTTDFAILFLPFESLYAEVLRTAGLFEVVQRECKVIITGPTTLSALLNSLQMGFRTLVIEKRSSEVWQLLGAVKTEFGNFAGILEKTNKKLQEASNVIDQASVRSRSIERKLKNVQELPKEQAVELLGNATELIVEEDINDQ